MRDRSTTLRVSRPALLARRTLCAPLLTTPEKCVWRSGVLSCRRRLPFDIDTTVTTSSSLVLYPVPVSTTSLPAPQSATDSDSSTLIDPADAVLASDTHGRATVRPCITSDPATATTLFPTNTELSNSTDGSLRRPSTSITACPSYGASGVPTSMLPHTVMLPQRSVVSRSRWNSSLPSTTMEPSRGGFTSRITCIVASITTSSPSNGTDPDGHVCGSLHSDSFPSTAGGGAGQPDRGHCSALTCTSCRDRASDGLATVAFTVSKITYHVLFAW
mmetsp:Transcript_10449/g.33206  ORF Transcript_10449/g.33206 Transcript_10449/m.33206 type:complete len:274 (-) Transcript_10449:111-932(-)